LSTNIQKKDGVIGIIVNCHNSEKHLDQTLQSLISQTYSSVCIFVINNQSTDRTLEIAKSYQSKGNVEIIETDTLLPLSSARNYALDKVLTDVKISYFSFCDSDDYLDNNWAERLMCTAQVNNYDLVHCNGNIVLGNNLVDADNFILGRFYRYRNPIYLNSCIINTKFYKNKIIRLDEKISNLYDHDLWIRALGSKCSFAHISDRLFYYRKHSGGMSNSLMMIMTQREKIRKKHGFSFFKFHLFTMEALLVQFIMNKSK